MFSISLFLIENLRATREKKR